MKRLIPILLALAVLASFAEPALAGRSSLDRCLSSLAGSVFHLYDKMGRCIRACEDMKREGELDGLVTCSYPSTHGPTQTCLLRAAQRLTGAKSQARKVCEDDEIAAFFGGSGTCFGENARTDDLLGCLQDEVVSDLTEKASQIYEPRPADPICGDGRITDFEQCDPNASPTGCAPAQICHPSSCSCTFRGCSNGIIERGEDCDQTVPSGCRFGEFCGAICECVGGSASRAFLQEPSESLLE